MPPPQVRIDVIADGLTSLGMTSEMEGDGDRISIQAQVPLVASREFWERLLALLADADTFGLISSARHGLVVWAMVRKGLPPPRDGCAVPVLHHQPQGSEEWRSATST